MTSDKKERDEAWTNSEQEGTGSWGPEGVEAILEEGGRHYVLVEGEVQTGILMVERNSNGWGKIEKRKEV